MKIEKTLLDDLKEKLEIPSFLYEDNTLDEARESMIEMARIKSDFDIEKFTVRKEGNFIAHNFHFLMRQYSLTMGETKRILIDREEKVRRIKDFEKMIADEKTKFKTIVENTEKIKYPDLEIKRLKNEIELIELNLIDKFARLDRYEIIRKKLIEENGGPITDEQYQKEEPAYWKWFLEKRALWQNKERVTGVKEGVWMNMDLLESAAVIKPEFVVPILNDNGDFLLAEIRLNDTVERVKNKGKKPIGLLGSKEIK